MHTLRTLISALSLAFPVLLVPTTSAAESAPGANITFSEDIAPILYDNCVYCHRETGVAPMSLIDYTTAKQWAPLIKMRIQEGVMPPWYAHADYGHFTNDLSITEEEKNTIISWVDAGAPEGDPSALPPVPDYPEGWQIGEPDLIVPMPDPFNVPATGTVEYQLVESDYVFAEDTWVQAIEILPGNSAVLHHAVASGVPDGDDMGEASGRTVALHLYSPGLDALIWRDGYGKLIPAGTRIHFNLHYTTNGIATTDLTRVGFVFAKKPIHTEVKTTLVMNTAVEIPPLVPNYQVIAGFQFPTDGRILALRPHLHLRGKNNTSTVITPDGKRDTVLYIPDWDDNWQNYYIFSEAISAPKGTILEFTTTYDNSAANRFNPDPQSRVTWGQQAWDEMMVVYMTWIENNEHNINDHLPVQIPVKQVHTSPVITGSTPSP